jgi:hypothetical protein
MRNFDAMLEEMNAFQMQTEHLISNLAAIDGMMGNINRDLTNLSNQVEQLPDTLDSLTMAK